MKVFAYGTLREHCSRHHVFQAMNARKLHPDFIFGKMFAPCSDWPFIVIESNTYTVITGEVYEFDDSKIGIIDRIEGYEKGRKNNLFERIQTTTCDSKQQVYVYVGSKYLIESCTNKKRIDYGDWLAYKLMLLGYARNSKTQQLIRQRAAS